MQALEMKLLSLPPSSFAISNPRQNKQYFRFQIPGCKTKIHTSSLQTFHCPERLSWSPWRRVFWSKKDHRINVCGLRCELQLTSGDLTWTFSLQELRPFPTAFGGGDETLLWTDSPGCNRPLPGM